MTYFAGIDIGSTASKVVVLDGTDMVDHFVLPTGWSSKETAGEIARRLDARTWPGAVICLHDGRGAPGATLRTIQALHIQLPRWREAGFIFLTLEE